MGRGIAFVLVFVFALVAPSARADDGAVHLKWNDCPFEPDASMASCMPCFTEGTMSLLGTFELDREISNVVGMELWLDWHFQELDEVPVFWILDGEGCNAHGVALRTARPSGRCAATTTAMCDDVECDVVLSYVLGPTNGLPPNRGTLVVGIYRPEPSPLQLAATPARHFAFELEFDYGASRECAGCASAGTLAWTTAVLYTPRGAVSTEGVAGVLTAQNPRSDAWTYVNMRGPSEPCPVVATRSTSWGRLKSLYR